MSNEKEKRLGPEAGAQPQWITRRILAQLLMAREHWILRVIGKLKLDLGEAVANLDDLAMAVDAPFQYHPPQSPPSLHKDSAPIIATRVSPTPTTVAGNLQP